MKRSAQSLVLVLIVFAISGYAQTPPPAQAETWKEFSSAAGRFKVLLPGDPTETSETTELPLGKIERHKFTLEAGFASFRFSYSDFPITLTKPGEIKKFLDQLHEANGDFFLGHPLSMTEIKLAGYPGREFKVATPDSMFRAKYFLVGNRLYQIAVATQTADFITRTWSAEMLKENAPGQNATEIARSMELFAAKFFDSFRLTGNPAMSRKPTPDAAIAKPVVVGKNGRAVAVQKLDPGSALKKVAPTYPAEAKAAGVAGKVEVQVTISEEGRVIEAIAISGPELLREVAVQAAKQWVFKPATANRVRVKVQGILTFNFTLQ